MTESSCCKNQPPAADSDTHVRAFEGSPSSPHTVAELTACILQQFGDSAAPIVRVIDRELAKVPTEQGELNAEHFRHLNTRQNAIVRALLKRVGTNARGQALIREVLDFSVECAAGVFDEHFGDHRLVDVIRELPKLLGFGLRVSEKKLLAELADVSAQRFSEAAWMHRDEIYKLAKRLHLKELIALRVVPTNEVPLQLQHSLDGSERVDVFAKALRHARTAKNLTQRALAASIGIPFQELHHWEKGKQPPGPSRRAEVERAAEILQAPDLEQMYEIARTVWSRTHPHSEYKRVKLSGSLPPRCENQFERWIEWECEREDVMRRGKQGSSGPLAPNSIRNYRQLFGTVCHYMQAPRRGVAPAFRGLGLVESEVDIAAIAVHWKAALKKRWDRQGREWAAQGDFSVLAKLRDLFGEDGYLSADAEHVAKAMPAKLLEMLPTHFPPKGAYRAQRCRNNAERLKAACIVAQELIDKYVKAARGGNLARHHFDCLQQVLRRNWHVLDGVMTLLCRIPRSLPRNVHEAEQMMAAAMLCIDCVRPARTSALGKMLIGDVRTARDANITEACFKIIKNERSRRAEEAKGEYRAIPGLLGELLRDFVDFARPMLVSDGADQRLFPPRRGKVLKDAAVRKLFGDLTRRYAPDIFPEGLHPRAMRSIVATDLFTRFGIRGLHLAADALVDHAGTTAKAYICRDYVAERCQPGEATVEAAIAFSFETITGVKFVSQALLPGETLRYPLKSENVLPAR